MSKEKRRLTREEKRQVAAAIERAKRTDKKQMSAQQSIPYQWMYQDGMCRITDNYYSKTIEFQDINYQLAQNEDKEAIFENWCEFLNYFDSSIHFQFTFFNTAAGADGFENSIHIEPQRDDFNSIRSEYAEMLKIQLSKGNNGLVKTKYLTFGIEADNPKLAKHRLERIENDIRLNFKRMGVATSALNGQERLRLMHGIFHMDGDERFAFDWNWLPPSGLSTKDFIAPSGFEFREGRTFRMGKKYGAVSFLQIIAPKLKDRILVEFLDLENSAVVNMHIQSIDQTAAIRNIKRKITDLDKMKIESQKQAVRSGYDMDILPSDLAIYGAVAKDLLQDLQNRNERMFQLTFTILNTADTKQQLENAVFAVQGIAQQNNCQIVRLDYQQEEGLMSSLPLGMNQVEIHRGLTTSSVAVFVPFTTQELFQMGGEALYYGLNALSNNMIFVDRKLLKNPNGLYHKGTGTPRKTQARAPFAAQTDKERRKRAERENIQKVFGSSSDLHPVFLLFVRGRFRTAQAPDCPIRKQERSFATFYTNRLQNSMRKGAAA